jgi:hypothetical protein
MAGVKVVLADGDLRALERLAAVEGSTIERLVQQAVRDYLARYAEPDPDWQRRFDDLIARIQNRIPPEIGPEEIEADVNAALAEVREERRARDG